MISQLLEQGIFSKLLNRKKCERSLNSCFCKLILTASPLLTAPRIHHTQHNSNLSTGHYLHHGCTFILLHCISYSEVQQSEKA